MNFRRNEKTFLNIMHLFLTTFSIFFKLLLNMHKTCFKVNSSFLHLFIKMAAQKYLALVTALSEFEHLLAASPRLL